MPCCFSSFFARFTSPIGNSKFALNCRPILSLIPGQVHSLVCELCLSFTFQNQISENIPPLASNFSRISAIPTFPKKGECWRQWSTWPLDHPTHGKLGSAIGSTYRARRQTTGLVLPNCATFGSNFGQPVIDKGPGAIPSCHLKPLEFGSGACKDSLSDVREGFPRLSRLIKRVDT